MENGSISFYYVYCSIYMRCRISSLKIAKNDSTTRANWTEHRFNWSIGSIFYSLITLLNRGWYFCSSEVNVYHFVAKTILSSTSSKQRQYHILVLNTIMVAHIDFHCSHEWQLDKVFLEQELNFHYLCVQSISS